MWKIIVYLIYQLTTNLDKKLLKNDGQEYFFDTYEEAESFEILKTNLKLKLWLLY
jgi:hypothetical protein